MPSLGMRIVANGAKALLDLELTPIRRIGTGKRASRQRPVPVNAERYPIANALGEADGSSDVGSSAAMPPPGRPRNVCQALAARYQSVLPHSTRLTRPANSTKLAPFTSSI